MNHEVRIGEHTVLFDDEGLELYENHPYVWSVIFDHNGYYLRSKVYEGKKRLTISFHRHFMGSPKGLLVDHKNGNTLDNRKLNLRVCTTQQNSMNRHHVSGKSRFKGVCVDKRTGRFRVMIRINKVKTHIGNFKDEVEAAKAYDAAATKQFGQFAKLNFS